jgi:large repetitive protein
MKTFTRQIFTLLIVLLAAFVAPAVQGQSILNPADVNVLYNPAAPPTQPAGGTIGKWVHTKRVSWNTNNYKCYIYNGQCFRLRFPQSYNPTAVDGKKYPVMVFFHGDGEAGPVTDNEYQLFHGGDVFDAAVTGGKFDGYVLAMQTTNGFWGQPVYGYIQQILDYMIANNKVDPFRINLNGLSAGGEGTWQMLFNYPTYTAGAVPMSNASLAYISDTSLVKYTPMWLVQGGLDGGPDPGTTQLVVNAMNAAGANLTYTLFPKDGHDTWDDTWKQPNFWPFMNNTYMSNPYALFGRFQFCPGDAINIRVGLVAGMQGYQWRMNGTVIPGATSNSIQVTQLGTYDARVERNGVWSDWSHTPLVVSIKQPTVSPTITIPALTSNVIPALDTSHGATLQVPTGYASYLWQAVGGNTTLSTTNTLTTTTPGSYQVKVTEQFGCSSSFSTPYTVINANGANKPAAAAGLTVTTVSQTALRLDWTANPSQQFPQTGFEVYQATKSGGPYNIVALLGANTLLDTVKNLLPGGKYFYVVRAVNASAAAAASNEASGVTTSDVQAPTAPSNLTVVGTTHSSVFLKWTASTDNIAVTSYDVYVNGVKLHSTTGNADTVYNLQYPTSYTFAVTARDFAKNISPFSNQVSAEALGTGLSYKFTTLTSVTTLPDFGSIVPTKTGTSTTGFSLSPATATKNYAFLWEGFLHITAAGTYQIRSTSVDGSKIYLGTLNDNGSPYVFPGTPIVSNDGVHGSTAVTSAPLTLAVGTYPIAVEYFHGASGTGSITVAWTTPSSGTFTTIPSSAFADVNVVNGQAPNAPSNLVAIAQSSSKIGLTWSDNSSNETAYEIWRSTSPATGFTTIGTALPGATSFTDSNLAANTRYYYEVRGIDQYGQSTFGINYTEANWQFNGNFNDSTGNAHALTAIGSPVFDAATKTEGSASLKLNGTTQAVTIGNTGSFLQTSFAQRTVAAWIQSSNNTGNRVIFDIGGSDNGLSLILNSNTLIAGVASGNTRATITAPYTNTTSFSHVALVYNGDSLMLYCNGVLVASNTALSFHSISTTTNGSRIGQINGTIASNTTGTGLFSGWIDAFGVYNSAFGADVITSLMNFTYAQSNAMTQALPAIPTAPTGLVAQGSSTASSVTIHWTDNATNETSYQVYRSASNNTNYLLLATLPANAVSYKDSGLFANAAFYYKVRAVNTGGSSAFSNEDSAHTKDNLPVLATITPLQHMRYGTQLVLNVNATDADPDVLTVSVTGLPAFGTYVSTGNGTGTLTFNPAQANQGVFSPITVTVTDPNGGTASQTFSLTVDNNFNPVITRPVANVSLNELTTSSVNLAATDQNTTDVLTWSFTGLPGFATVTTSGNNVQLALAPGLADGGVYAVQARVDDGHQGFDTLTFTITAVQVPLPTTSVFVHFSGSDGATAGAPWNNTLSLPTQNKQFLNLTDQTGANSGIGLTITTPWQSISFGDGTNTFGQTTGNNSGVYPDAVLGSAYFTDQTPNSIKVSGLDVSTTYNFTFFGSRGSVNDDRTTVYSVTTTAGGTSSVSLQTANNTANTVSINGVRPNPDSTVTLTLAKGTNAPFGYMNSVVISKVFNDHSVPAKPRSIAGQIVNNSKVGLTWVAAAYNALSYQVYRSQTVTGPYTLLNPGAANPTQASYTDSLISQNNTYYYYVTATNGNGVSPSSDTVTMVIPDLAPSLTAISNVTAGAGQTSTVTVIATDAATDAISLQLSGLPAFASFTDHGDGTGTITLAPGTNDLGSFAGVVTATDNHGASSTTPVNVSVTFANLRNIYINFNDGTASEPAQGAPWNNTSSAPNVGAGVANLKDDQGALTGYGITLLDAWAGSNNTGTTTGNNSGVYPDNVMQDFYFDDGGGAKRMNITGLSPRSKYNVIFFAARGNATDNRITHYAIGSQSVQLNAADNTQQTVAINNVSPDATGKILLSMTKDAGAPFALIGAIQIQYSFDTTFFPPSGLSASSPNTSSIVLNWGSNAPTTTTGFEIWRSTTPNGPFNLLNTVAGSVTTYTDGSLPAGSGFFYEVRAIAGTRQSAFSNIAGGSTVAYSVKIQFNDGAQNKAQGGTWNSTNTLIFPGFELPNLINTQGHPTGINMDVTGPFSGYNVFGAQTGNNTGVYPDNVMQGFFYEDFGDTARLAISGLDLTSTYNFNFFGSRANPVTSVISTYVIGNTLVTQDATNNTSTVTQISGVKPDSTGTVNITLYNGTGGRGYLNALTIDGVPSAFNSFAQTPVATLAINNGQIVGTANTFAADSTKANNLMKETKITAFPNPFFDAVNLSFQLPQPVAKVLVSVVDVSGRVVFRQEMNNLPQGTSVQKLGLNSRNLPSGSYFVLLQGLPEGSSKSVQMLKMGR